MASSSPAISMSESDLPFAGAFTPDGSAWSIGAVDVPDPPLDGGRIQPHEAQEVTVPDGSARVVAVHADAPPGQVRGLPDRAASADVQVARREVAQRKHGEADIAAIALVDAVEVLRHRPLAALHAWVLHGAPEHLGARRPRAPAAKDHRERDPLRLHRAGHE